MNLDEIPTARGHPAPFTAQYKRLEGGPSHAVVCVPVHSMTHRDFPINVRDGLRVSDVTPAEMPAAILDFRSKRGVLEHYLLATGDSAELPELTGPEAIPFLDLALVGTAEGLVRLVQDLAITKEEVEEAIEELGMPISKCMVVFRTDWLKEFHRHRVSYGNPFLEGHSAYLCHPYMTPKAIDWLLEQGVRAIGHDLPSFENPLLYAKGANVIPMVQTARSLMDDLLAQEGVMLEDRAFESGFNSVRSERDILPVYIKLLSFTRARGGLATDQVQHMESEIAVIPIPAIQDPYGVACEVYVAREG